MAAASVASFYLDPTYVETGWNKDSGSIRAIPDGPVCTADTALGHHFPYNSARQIVHFYCDGLSAVDLEYQKVNVHLIV